MEQNYIDWEKIDQKEYRIKISTYVKKLNDQQKKLFFEVLDSIKDAGGAEERMLSVLLEETGNKYKEETLYLMLEYLKKDKKLGELEFYKKKAHGAEEKSRLLKKEIMGLKVKKRELEEILTECQEKILLAEQENRDYSGQKEILLRIQENVEQIAARSEEIKEWPKQFVFVQKKEQHLDDSVNVPIIETDKKEILGSVPVPETIPIEPERREVEPEGKEEEIEADEKAFYEEFQGIALENAIDPEEYGTFMEAAPGEILYYPLEEEDEPAEEFEEAGKNQRIKFFNHLLEKMDSSRFQKLKPSEQISKLFELMEDRQISKEEKKVFMKIIQESGEEDYIKIYQYIKEGREKELLKEEWHG